MTDQTIRPSTTKKITTAMPKTMSYRSRMWAPWTLFAAGGKKLFQIADAFRATRTRTPIAMTAATSQPTIVRDDGLLPGVVDIDGPRTQSARRTRNRASALVEADAAGGRPFCSQS